MYVNLHSVRHVHTDICSLFKKFSKLLDISVWLDAASQNFFMFGLGFVCIVAMASKMRWNLIGILNILTGLFFGTVIFPILGASAYSNFFSPCVDRYV